MAEIIDACILISAGAEWRALLPHFNYPRLIATPYREYFKMPINGHKVIFFHSGSGKVAAAGSTQYAIDHWKPKLLINIGTCGGFVGHAKRGEIFLAEKTIIYDIIEKMSDQDQAIERYAVSMDWSHLPEELPQNVTIAPILSADRDILSSDIPDLVQKYHASVADWESGAISWVAQRNKIPCLILRAVSDLVDLDSGEAYDDYAFFEKQCQPIMADFAQHLSQWLEILLEKQDK